MISFFSFCLTDICRLWIKICLNLTNNSILILCRKILNYTRHSTCWFRLRVPWVESWFIASSKETRWKNLLSILIQVCKEFYFLLFFCSILLQFIDFIFILSIRPSYIFSSQPLSILPSGIDFSYCQCRCCFNYFTYPLFSYSHILVDFSN